MKSSQPLTRVYENSNVELESQGRRQEMREFLQEFEESHGLITDFACAMEVIQSRKRRSWNLTQDWTLNLLDESENG